MSTAIASHVESRTPEVSSLKSSSSTLLVAACAVLLLAPLCFGAVQYWAIFAMEASSTLLFGAWASRQWIRQEVEIVPNPVYSPMCAFLALTFLQWAVGSTAYRQATYFRLLLYCSYAMIAFVVTQTLRRSSQLRSLAWIVCSYGSVVALFALLQGLAPNGKLYWIWSFEHTQLIYGPYVNHNHYAALMEMLSPFPLALAVSRFTHHNRKLAAAGAGALMAGSIFLSGSRGGMLAFGAQAIVIVLLLAREKRENWKQPALMAGFLLVAITFVLWIGGTPLTRRIASIHSETRQEFGGGTRLSIDRDCLRMWAKRPILGWGLGTFPEVYPQFRSFYTDRFANQAHNDYLQLLVETGLAGFAIAAWFLVLTLRRARGKLSNWTETPNGVLTAACLLGCVGILVHSFLDFNLQIPANAALFYVLCAIAAAEPMVESVRRRHARRSNHAIREAGDQVSEP